ncbi:MAG: hypothetical protein IJ834_05120 [Paludibacteraceae bacterium]|nr:hypothetical protein [Paludibacteraceae bacterium]
MKKVISLSFVCALALNLFSLELIPIKQMGEPYNAYGGLRLDSFVVMDEVDASESYKYVYQYSSDGRIIVQSYYKGYNSYTKRWIGSSKEEYTYYPGGSTIFRNYTWDTATGDWTLNRQVNDNYDSNGHNTSTIYFDWDNSTNSLIFSSKKEYTYSSGTQPTIIISSTWNNSKWVNTEKNRISI